MRLAGDILGHDLADSMATWPAVKTNWPTFTACE
jgi:hypothetical protein